MNSRASKVRMALLRSFRVLIIFSILGLIIFAGPPATGAFQQPVGPQSFSKLAEAVSPSVVNVSAVKIVKSEDAPSSPFAPGDPFHEFFRRYFGDQMPREFKQRSLGSGFIINRNGFILTNNHVVEKTEEIEVTLNDKTSYPARIIGRDPRTDLALIKIDPKKEITPLPLGNSDQVQVGDWVVAVGSPFGLGHTVTAGIVSAKFRRIGASAYVDFIQTDASINPGNSGGPLLDNKGEVIGINTAIFSESGGNIGIGFAIPINIAKDLLPQLEKGKVVRGWLGVMIQEITPELQEKFKLESSKGALVSGVQPGSPADKAGIKRGDVVVTFDGKKIEEMHDLPYLVANTPVGKKVDLEVVRKGKKQRFAVEIGELEQEIQEKPEESETTPNLGMTVRELTPDLARENDLTVSEGIFILQVQPNSAAAEAGLRSGDVIVEVDQEPVKDMSAFINKIRSSKSGDTVLFLVNRGGSTLYLTIKMP